MKINNSLLVLAAAVGAYYWWKKSQPSDPTMIAMPGVAPAMPAIDYTQPIAQQLIASSTPTPVPDPGIIYGPAVPIYTSPILVSQLPGANDGFLKPLNSPLVPLAGFGGVRRR